MSGLCFIRWLQKPIVVSWFLTDRFLAPLLLACQGIEGCRHARFVGIPSIRKADGSRIVLGKNVKLVSRSTGNPLRINQPCSLATLTSEAMITIGDDSGLSGVVICASRSVKIGHRVLIGSNCVIMDTDFHPLDPQKRKLDRTAGANSSPVYIGDDVFIGTRVIILKGSVLGEGCVVGAGAVVSGEFPPGVVIGGNPASIIGYIK